MKKYSVIISGHRTSISMEPDFWQALHKIAQHRAIPFIRLIQEIDDHRTSGLSSAIRVFVLKELQKEIGQKNA